MLATLVAPRGVTPDNDAADGAGSRSSPSECGRPRAGYVLPGIGPHHIDWYRLDIPDSLAVEVTTGPNT